MTETDNEFRVEHENPCPECGGRLWRWKYNPIWQCELCNTYFSDWELTPEQDAYLRRYQGAIVECFNTGVYRGNIIKYDVKSMYPSIMVALNLSPENVRLIDRSVLLPHQTTNPKLNGNKIELCDSYVGKLTLEVVGDEDSVTRRALLDFTAIREKYRAARDVDPFADSKQQAIKLIMNSLYGYNGLEFARYGSFLVAIVTTAIGRWIMGTIIDTCKRANNNVTLLECDTDGLMAYGDDITDEINRNVRALFAGYEYGHKVGVEPEYYDGAIVYASKNYVLKRGSSIMFKGSGFHGRHMPPICATALRRFAQAIFDREIISKVWTEFHDLRQYPLSEFSMNVSLNKQLDQYDEHTMYRKLADKLGDNAAWGQEITYVKTKRKGYMPLGVVTDEELRRLIDYNYYYNRIVDVVSRLIDPLMRQGRQALDRWLE